MKDTISVIIPYYKSKKFFKKCFNSIEKQTYQPKEILIICDEPTREAQFFLKKITKKNIRVKIFFNKKNYGVSYSRNLGIKKSNSKFIAFLDSDDYWKKNKLKDQVNFMKKNNINFSHTSYNIIGHKNKVNGSFIVKKRLSYQNLLKRCDIGTSTVMVKKQLIKKYKFPRLSNQEDYCVWLRIAEKEKIYGLKKPYTYWRDRSGSLSSQNLEKIKNAFYVYHKHLGKNKTVSLIRLFILIWMNIIKKLKFFVQKY